MIERQDLNHWTAEASWHASWTKKKKRKGKERASVVGTTLYGKTTITSWGADDEHTPEKKRGKRLNYPKEDKMEMWRGSKKHFEATRLRR